MYARVLLEIVYNLRYAINLLFFFNLIPNVNLTNQHVRVPILSVLQA